MKPTLNNYSAIGLIAVAGLSGVALLYQTGWPASQIQIIVENLHTWSSPWRSLNATFLLLAAPIATAFWLRQRRLRYLNKVIAIRNIACKVTAMLELKSVTPRDLACLEASIIELQQSDYAQVSPLRLADHFVDVIVYGLQLARLMRKEGGLDILEHDSVRILKKYCRESMRKLDDFLLSRGVDFQDNIALAR